MKTVAPDAPFTLVFLGAGSAFTTPDYYQSNLLLRAANGKQMLIDCGSDARFSLAEWCAGDAARTPHIDAVYISHLHSDHVGGLEWLAFKTYFTPGVARPTLFVAEELISPLWEHSLRAGLACITDQVMQLSDYFVPVALLPGQPFRWENLRLTPFRTVHVDNPQRPMYSFGLIIQEADREEALLFSSDTLLTPALIHLFESWKTRIRWIFQDCETTATPTGVHSHYTTLRTLPADIRGKMWLYHHHPNPPYTPQKDGFLGFVRKGQHFS